MQLLSPKTLLSLIGSFWSRIVAKPLLSERLMAGLLAAHYQSEVKADALVKSISNIEISAGEISTFEKFIFNSRTLVKAKYGVLPIEKHGSGVFYGTALNGKHFYDIPENIISIPTFYDNPVKPTRTYTENVDYKIVNSRIEFRVSLPESITLYARKVIKDTGFVHRQLGYVAGINLTDSIFRKVPLAELWRLFSYGPNYYNMMRMLSLCANSPIAKDNETVTGVGDLREGKLVITDKNCYFIPPEQDTVVQLNQTLTQGQPLASGLAILHDKTSYRINDNLPKNMWVDGKIKYGNSFLNPARTIIVKANIKGNESVVLKYFTNVLPLDVKVIVLANKDVSSAVVDKITSKSPTLATSVALPKYSNNSIEITAKSNSSLKYGFYGF
jgi:hypothetical protein